MFNAQLFEQFGRLAEVENICLVPEWRVWKWAAVRKWSGVSFQFSEVRTTYVPVFYVPRIGRALAWRTYLWSVGREIERFRGRVDAVYAAWLYPDGVVGSRIASALGVPAWIMVLGTDVTQLGSPARRKAILDACDRSRGIICVAKHLKDRLVDAGVEESKVHVVPNGVDTELFHYRPKEEALQLLLEVEDRRTEAQRCATVAGKRRAQGISVRNPPPATFHPPPSPFVLFVGNLVHVKGPDILLEAFATLVRSSKHRPPCTDRCSLVLIGEGPMKRGLQRRASELGLADRVHFLGARPHAEVALWMNVADVLCLSSRSEGMPNAVLEAMASGVPVVATDVGTCREMTKRYPAGEIVPDGDSGAVAKALRKCLEDDHERESLARVGTPASWGDMAARILSFLTL
jgi:glycosyltransferase involved in cell wall biosynthesis